VALSGEEKTDIHEPGFDSRLMDMNDADVFVRIAIAWQRLL
jgi:hypothetical protein